MNIMKLITAIGITAIIIGVIGLIVWLSDITDWRFRIILVFIGIVALVYCNL